MSDLGEATVIHVGGWDDRFAVVRAVRTLGDRAAAVVDANGDGADINCDHFQRTEGVWQLCSSGGGPGDWGRSWHDGMWAEHGQDGHGWSLTLEPGPLPEEAHTEDQRPETRGWYAHVPES